jgi:KDO2-lipid IV(A) lauroyltransferase
MESLSLFFTKAAISIAAILPFGLLYKVSDILGWVLNHALRYRKNIIRENLQRSFPSLSETQIEQLISKYYTYFADLIFETLKGFSMRKESLMGRFAYEGIEIFERYYQEGKNVILLAGHYGNWEWATLTFPLVVKHKVIGIYKPLTNKKMDSLLTKNRSKWGNNLVSMADARKSFIENKSTPSIFVLIADQSPSKLNNAQWVKFLNQDTPFLSGPDTLGRQTNYVILFCNVTRPARGHYKMCFTHLFTQERPFEEGEITRLYAGLLEQQILGEPAFWLWSHRRWKRSRSESTRSS